MWVGDNKVKTLELRTAGYVHLQARLQRAAAISMAADHDARWRHSSSRSDRKTGCEIF